MTKIWFEIKEVTAAQPYRRRHQGTVVVRVSECACVKVVPAVAIRKRLSGWRRMGQQNDPQPMGQLRSAAALWQCFGLCMCLCVCVRVPSCVRENCVENQKARLIVKGSVRLSHFKSSIGLRTEDFQVYAPRSVNRFRP